MSFIKGYIYKNKKGIIFIILVISCFVMMFLSNSTAVITFKKMGFSLVYPFQFVINTTGKFFQNTFNSISQLRKISEELDETRNELTQYKKIIIDFNELNNENLSLRRLLKLKEEVLYDTVACEVIGRDPQKLFDVIIINKGSKDGIKENMPVITYAAGKKTLIGKVIETGFMASKVITLQNPRISVGAVILRNRIHAILQGDNKIPGVVKLLYIPKKYEKSISGMDFVYTSGDSLIFPRGIEIGKVLNIYPSKRYEVFNEADIQITANLTKLEYVLVLKVEYNLDDYKLHGFPK